MAAEQNWIGGDFAGLQRMGSTLSGVVKELQGAVKPLDSGVESLVGAAGWQGDAADSFRAAWTKDSLTAGGFSDLVGSVGGILTNLGNTLADLNDALYNAYETARGQGVSTGPSGEPIPLLTGGGNPTGAEQQAIRANNDYAAVYKSITYQAQKARVAAAKALVDLHDQIDPGKPLGNPDKATIGIFLRDLYASRDDRKSAAAEKADEEVGKARNALTRAKNALKDEEASLAIAGKDVPADLSQYKAYRAAVSDYVKSQQALGAVEDSRNSFSKLINFKAGDVEALSRAIEGFKWAPDFLRDIPVVDVGAALVGAGFEAKQDHDEGWSWTHSVLVDGGIAVGGVVAGVAVGAAAVASLPADAVAAAAVAAAGTALLVGVGIDKAVHEHWSEDIHDHGVVGGILDGGWNVTKNTGKSIWDDGKGIWHGVTSIF